MSKSMIFYGFTRNEAEDIYSETNFFVTGQTGDSYSRFRFKSEILLTYLQMHQLEFIRLDIKMLLPFILEVTDLTQAILSTMSTIIKTRITVLFI